jgi:group I intron endonuclease
MLSGVYTITNVVNGHVYVGSSAYIGWRFKTHKRDLRRGTHPNGHLQAAWNKYGKGVFKFEVLEEWEPKFLVSQEQWWMNMLQPAYNICPVAHSNIGRKCSDETRAKMSKSLLGNTRALGCRHKHSMETRAKMSKSMMGNTNGCKKREVEK